jgi:hypothetical protein
LRQTTGTSAAETPGGGLARSSSTCAVWEPCGRFGHVDTAEWAGTRTSAASASAWPADANSCPCRSEVTLMVECPSRLLTTVMSAPDEIISDAREVTEVVQPYGAQTRRRRQPPERLGHSLWSACPRSSARQLHWVRSSAATAWVMHRSRQPTDTRRSPCERAGEGHRVSKSAGSRRW